MTDEQQFGTKTLSNLKIDFLQDVSKIDFFQCIDFTPYQQAKRHIGDEGGVRYGNNRDK